MSGNKFKPTKKGFTLIELLVVVAIIALLISILLPSLKRAKDQAKQIVCGTGQREQYTAATEYATSNRDYYPRGIQGINANPSDEYQVYASAILPYIGWDGKDRLWASSTSPGLEPGEWKVMRKRLNKLCLDFDVLHCNGFPVEFYDDPGDRRFVYHSSETDEWGPDLVNPMHYIASAFSMPYTDYAINNLSGGNNGGCWDEEAEQEGVSSGGPYHYSETSQLESFPVECQPSTKIYVTGIDKTVPWVKGRNGAGAGDFAGLRFHTIFLQGHLSFGDHPRQGEDSRHPGGLNNMFFDGHVKAFDPHKTDPGCEVPLDERMTMWTIPWDGWDGWPAP